jgi:hypothetical protein
MASGKRCDEAAAFRKSYIHGITCPALDEGFKRIPIMKALVCHDDIFLLLNEFGCPGKIIGRQGLFDNAYTELFKAGDDAKRILQRPGHIRVYPYIAGLAEDVPGKPYSRYVMISVHLEFCELEPVNPDVEKRL